LPSPNGRSPRLSLLLPTLNAAPYLVSALDSLANQTFTEFKVFVLDGGSTDETIAIARAYSLVSIEVLQCGRIGLGAQLQAGLHRVDTEFVARMDADDISLPNRLARQLEALEHSAAAIVGTQIELLIGARIRQGGVLPLRHASIRRALLTGFPAFCHPSVMFRTSAAIQCGGYRLAGAGEDLDFFLRITECGDGLNLAEVLHRYRLHDQSTSLRHFEDVKRSYSYAVDCAAARARGWSEPTPEQHLSSWIRRSSITRLATRLECFGVALYRASRLRMSEGNRLIGLLGAATSILLRPRLLRARAIIQWDMLWNKSART
jgi:glycosyltransferase involved in cell wall biosynthesis